MLSRHRGSLFKRPHAVRLPDHPGVQRNRHDAPARRGRLFVEQVKLVAQLVTEVVFGVVVLNQDGVVVDVDRVRHGVDGAAGRAYAVRHVVIDPVAHIVKSGCAQQVQRRGGLGLGR